MNKNLNTEFIIVIVGRFLQALILIASVKLATRYLLPEEMGRYYILSSIATLFGVVLISPVGQFLNRKLHTWETEGNLLSILAKYNLYIAIVSLLALPLIFIAKKFFGYIHEFDYFEVTWISVLSIFFNSWIGTLIPSINMLGHKKTFTYLNLINLFGGVVLSFILIKVFGNLGSVWYIGQYVLIQAIMIVVALYLLIKKLNINVDKKVEINFNELIRDIWKFSSPLMFATLFMWLLNDSYRFIVEKILGVAALGEIAVGFGVAASIFGVLESIFQQMVYPGFYKKIASSDYLERSQACSELINFGLPLFMFVGLFLSFSSPFIITILTSKAYEKSFLFLIFGIWVGFFRFSINLISTIAHSEYKTNTLILPYVISGCLNIIAIYVCLSFFQSSFIIGPILIVSNLLAFILLKARLSKLVSLSFSMKNLWMVFFWALPFVTELYFQNNNGLISSLMIMLCYGIYFAFIVFWKFKFTNLFVESAKN